MADANVRVLVSAITEAAQQSLESVGDEMDNMAEDGHIAAEGLDAAGDEMSAATRSAMILQAALDEVGDEANNLTLDAEVLQAALDEVGDEELQAAWKAQAASASMEEMAGSEGVAAVATEALSSAFMLSFIPAILTAATVLAPLIVTLGAVAAGAVALAGAFGLIVGSGILAFGQQKAEQNKEELDQTERLISQYETMQATQGELNSQQKDRLRQLRKKKKALQDQQTATGALAGVVADLKEELAPLITEFGREFVPLIKEAVDAIPDVVREMLNAVGGTSEFKQALREFGSIAADVLPALVGLMFDLARAALPVLRDFVSFLQDNGNTALQDMKDSVKELWPELMNLLDALIDMAPTLLEFGTNVGEVLIPALTELVRAADGFMETVNGMDESTQKMVITTLLLLPALVKLASILIGLAGPIGTAIELLGGLATWLAGILPTAYELGAAFGSIEAAASSLASVIAGSTAALVAVGVAIGLIGVKILDMLGVFDAVADAGQMLGEVLGKDMVDSILVLLSVLTLGLFPLIAAIGAAIVELVRGDISGAVDNFMQIWDIFGSAFSNVGNMVVKGLASLGQWFVNVFTSIGSFVFGWISDLADGFVNFFIKTLPKLVLQGLVFLVSAVEVQLNSLFNLFADAFNGIISLISTAIDTVINGVISIVNQFLKGIDGVANAVSDVIGRDIGDIQTIDQVDTSQIAQDLNLQRRNTNFQQARRQNQQAVQGIQRQINNTEVNVDVGGDLQQDPYSFSRSLADQVNREKRSNSGT